MFQTLVDVIRLVLERRDARMAALTRPQLRAALVDLHNYASEWERHVKRLDTSLSLWAAGAPVMVEEDHHDVVVIMTQRKQARLDFKYRFEPLLGMFGVYAPELARRLDESEARSATYAEELIPKLVEMHKRNAQDEVTAYLAEYRLQACLLSTAVEELRRFIANNFPIDQP